MTVQRPAALLLLGPTGSGKTPLGQLLEECGLHGSKCVHFDFGQQLRAIVARNQPDETISRADIDFLRNVLASGALLEDEQFPLAQRILRAFLARHGVGAETFVVLNGLPRHVGQARAIDEMLNVRIVICLECSSDTVAARLTSNVGGDRSGRADDNLDQVRTKLAVYHRRTAPLVDYYRRQAARVETIHVTADTTAGQMLAQLPL